MEKCGKLNYKESCLENSLFLTAIALKICNKSFQVKSFYFELFF